MLDFAVARKKILQEVEGRQFRPTERLALSRASGRVLAEQVVSPIRAPGHDYSAMDGYAVCAADLARDLPRTLPVLGECRTGHPVVAVERGGCVRIFTGAHIPPGADAVVMQENVEVGDGTATFSVAPRPFEHIRRAGEDLQRGDEVLAPGARLSGYQLGLLASVERTEVLVAARPRVTILCTGDELRPPAGAAGAEGLSESNSVALAALAADVGADPAVGSIVPDELRAMKSALETAAGSSDVIVTVGGVSVGDHDVVEPALGELGAEIVFHKVRIKPGKPVLFAKYRGVFILALPGNPSAAQVTFGVFGIPLLRAWQGDERPLPPTRRARLVEGFRQKPGRLGLHRGRLDGDEVRILSNQASGATTSIAWSNALLCIDETKAELEAGAEVSVLSLGDL